MERCPLCPGNHNCVPTEWGKCNDYIFIGEAPGKVEDAAERVFWGKTGKELTEGYLPIAGIKRPDVTITNAIKCLPPGPEGRLNASRTRDLELLYSCANHHLYNEIAELSPKLIIPMGTFACHAIDPSINLDLQHGIPTETSFGMAFPMYHPASGIHEPKRMLMIRNDWIRLGRYIKGKLDLPQDTIFKPDYSVITRPELESLYFHIKENDTHFWPLSCDTEVTRYGEPFCITFSLMRGTGRFIHSDDADSLEVFQSILNLWEGPILFHNYLFDSDVVSSMGLIINYSKIVDTMVRAYHLGNLPQGLKALAYRLLGMQMQDFDDLTLPYSTPIMLRYIRDAYNKEWPKPEEQLVKDTEGQLKLYKPQSIKIKLKRFLSDYAKNPLKDIMKAWANWEENHKLIESICGPWPGMDIRHVPLEKAVYYACRDADATFRLWPILQSMTRQIRRRPQEHWADYLI